jgi:hypothetical protein
MDLCIKGKIRINTWITKTFLRNNGDYYTSQLNANSLVLEVAKNALQNQNVKEVRTDWEHYCGAEPRYWDIEIDGDTIYFNGGNVWKARIEGDVLYLDNCATKEMLLNVVNEGLKQVGILKLGKSLYELVNS